MRNTGPFTFSSPFILSRILFVLLGSTALLLTVNSFDSGIIKTPLLALFAGLLLAMYAAQAIWRRTLEFRRSPADIPVLIFLFLIAVSALYSAYQWTSLQALASWVAFIACFFAGTQLFARQDQVRTLVSVAAAIASVVCLVGMIQFFFADKLVLDFFLGEDRRISSTLTNATFLSGYIVLLFPALLAFTLTESKKKRWLLVVLLCGLAFLLLATSTRSSIVAFFLSLIVFALMQQQRRAMLWTVAAALVVTATVFLSPRLVQRVEASFESGSTSSFARRVYFWKGGYEAWKSAPYFGHGIGTFSEVILQYRSAEYWVVKSEDLVPHAHNELIETAVDLGGVGIIAYLAIVVTVFVSGLQTWPKQNQRDRLLRIGIFCSLLAILIDNLANVSLRVAPVGATAWLLMGVLASGPNAPVRTTGVRMKKWFAVVPLGAWLLFATWFGSQQWKMYKADGHVLKGFVAGMSNQPGKAASEYQQAVAYDPHNLLARSDLTLTLLRLGRPEEALLSAEQLQGLSPRYPKASLMQAAALVSLKRYSEALRSIDKELELRNHPDAFFYQASAYRGLADSTKEISALKNVLLGSLKGHIAYQGMTISRRLRQLVRTEEDIKQFREIYVQLASMFPSDSTITSTLAEFELRLTRLKQGSKPTSY